MLSSLRSRLWLTYAILIVTALSLVALILFFSLFRSPLLYRQTIERLRAVGEVVTQAESSPLFASAEQTARTFDVRILLYSADRQVLWDTNSATDAAMGFPVKRRLSGKLPLVFDTQGTAWLYSVQKLADDTHLMVALPRPRLTFLNIFSDDLLPIFFQSGLIALLLSL